MKTRTLLAVGLAAVLVALPSVADEGMWLLNDFPSEKVQKKYGFAPTQPWLDHVRLSSVRLAGGCSASFVSANGLVMTNHHCAHGCIEQLSSAKKDLIKSGFFAQTEKDELKCPAVEVNQLVEISDVTSRITSATSGLADKAFYEKQKAEIAKIEKECATSDQVRCDVVSLYRGGKYHLYKYRRHQDVRLVFAPELDIAFFGGDPDNFMFPRWALDVAFLRVYQDGKPLKTDHHLAWSAKGPAEGELVFVSGHPGSTNRLLTVAQLEYERDVKLPRALMYLAELRGYLTQFQTKSAEHKRIATKNLFYVENSLKALKGRHAALLDKGFFAQKVEAEKALRAKVDADPKLKAQYGQAWDGIAQAIDRLKTFRKRFSVIEGGFRSELFGHARTLVRAADELPKPNEQRLPELSDSKLPALKHRLFSTAPIYDELEIAMLTFELTKAREELTPDDPFIKKVLGQKSPEEVARELVKGSKLKDVKVRKALFEGGEKAVAASNDPMIALARAIDPEARELRKRFEEEVEGPTKKNAELVAQAMFKVYGTSTYPDATFTLRLSYGAVKGWTEDGKDVKPFTTIAGAFDRHTGREPFALPKSWLAAQRKLDGQVPLNLVADTDIIGGNSGSPMINQKGEIVGLVFDGNIHSLGGDYGFDAKLNRTVAVHSAALIETLEKVYGARRILDELRPSASATSGAP